jgi:hypothetical protein
MSKTQIATGGISDDAVTIAKATGFGKLGQIVTDNFTGTESTTVLASAGNFTDSSLSASITPTATSSKILVLASVNTGASSNGDGAHIGRFRQAISGGSTTSVFVGASAGSRIQTSSGRGNAIFDNATNVLLTFNFLLTPSTTSAVTITYQFAARGGGSGTAYINVTGNDSNVNENQAVPSALTLIEVLA